MADITKRKIPKKIGARRAKGLSNTTYLSASFKVRFRQNGEAQAFTSISGKSKFPKSKIDKEEVNTAGTSKKKSINSKFKKGLDYRSKRSVRVISECFMKFLSDDDFFSNVELDRNDYPSSCRLITLTFRNIIPSDKEAKKLLHNFFRRWQRRVGRTIFYIWVAERQKRGAIHFHILTPEYAGFCKNYFHELVWVNRTWNEVVLNHSIKTKVINSNEAITWKNEILSSESYFKSLTKFKRGQIKSAPKKPSKSTLLLLPNVTKVYSAGNYMAKYISKENENIIGGMFDASKRSRTFLDTKDVVCKKVISEISSNHFCNFVYHRAKIDNVFVAMSELEHNKTKMIWCKDGYYLMQLYYEYFEIYGGLDTHFSEEKMKKINGQLRPNKQGNYIKVKTKKNVVHSHSLP